MFLLQSPPSTRFDLKLTLAGIPVRVHPLFWLLTLFLGSSLGGILPTLIWIFVVFISILIHEMGHALAFRRYGVESDIVLHFAGGLTIPRATPWGGGWANVSPSPGQQINISLAGPFAGFILAGIVIMSASLLGGTPAGRLVGFVPVPQFASFSARAYIVNQFIAMMLWVNVFWGLINLLPVFPLDGGQVARNILIQYDPIDGTRKSIWLSVIAGGLAALAGWIFWRNPYMTLLFGVLAFQSYQALSMRY